MDFSTLPRNPFFNSPIIYSIIFMKNDIKKKLKLGIYVKLKYPKNIIGSITKINNKRITIKYGNINLEVSINDIECINPNQSFEIKEKIKKTTIPINLDIKEITNFIPQIDLHSLSLNEAIETLDRFIDKTQIMGHKYLKIIHGKGTGTLRTGIRKYLKTDSRIKEIMINNILFEGSSGVTWIEIK